MPLTDCLLVANRATGTVSVIDPRGGGLKTELPVADRLADAAPHPGPADALLLDDRRHRLLSLTLARPEATAPAQVRELTSLPPHPARLATDVRRHRLFVTSLWSRQLTILQCDERFQQVKSKRRQSLPFAPRELLWLEHRQLLLVADAFGGQLAIFRLEDGGTLRATPLIRRLPAHNIRGLAAGPDGATVYVSHQTLDPEAWTTRDSVHWGILMANTLRALRIDALLDPSRDVLEGAWLEQHGLVGSGAGDPGPIWRDARGRLAVALSGVNRVAVTGASYALTLPVGRRPLALAARGDTLYVVNHLDDSVTIIDLKAGEVRDTVVLGTAGPLTALQRGERLFYDARLSHDGWMSCHSCHSEGHSPGLLADTRGDGDYGAPKRIPSLLGTAGTGPWAWNGSAESLEQQIGKSVLTTMHGARLSGEQVSDLAAYLRSLQPPPPRGPSDPELVRRGAEVFRREGCIECHQAPAYTSAGTYDVGLVDEAGNRRFNPPSLRGVGQRDRLLHDGRARSLEDVLLDVRHQLDEPLEDADRAALLAFLKSL